MRAICSTRPRPRSHHPQTVRVSFADLKVPVRTLCRPVYALASLAHTVRRGASNTRTGSHDGRRSTCAVRHNPSFACTCIGSSGCTAAPSWSPLQSGSCTGGALVSELGCSTRRLPLTADTSRLRAFVYIVYGLCIAARDRVALGSTATRGGRGIRKPT